MKEYAIEDEAKGILEYMSETTSTSARDIYTSFIEEAYNNLGPEGVLSQEEELEVLFIEEHKEEIIKEMESIIKG